MAGIFKFIFLGNNWAKMSFPYTIIHIFKLLLQTSNILAILFTDFEAVISAENQSFSYMPTHTWAQLS